MINLPDFDADNFIEKACDFIRNKVEQTHTNGVVLGISGGIDSAVVAYLAVKALGSSNVHGYILPSNTTPEQDLKDAKTVVKNLQIEENIINIGQLHNNFLTLCDNKTQPETNKTLATLNIKPRIRMTILYYYAAIHNCLVIGTGNKTELSIGYFTKYGDGGIDISPIGDLYKQEVFRVAEALNIPDTLIQKAPTAGLLPNQTDEKELGMTYPQIDRLLYLYLDESKDEKEIAEILVMEKSEVERIIRLYNNSEHKRNTAPILKK